MIQAKVIADSLSPTGDRLTTLEIVFPRYILAELNTHRLFSKNSASSRAIPFKKMIKEVENNPFIPYAFQKDHSGMQGTEYITDEDEIKEVKEAWLKAKDLAVSSARLLNEGLDVSKQLANRLLEPFLYHKVLISATEWENFFNLRCPQYTTPNGIFKSRKEAIKSLQSPENKTVQCYSCEDILDWLKINQGQADIHMMFLAEAIYDAIQESTPKKLRGGEWHIPYGDNMDSNELKMLHNKYCTSEYNPDNPMPDSYFTEALDSLMCKVSIARCARLSYQTLGDNPVIDYEKDLELYDILSKSGHWSPFEHVARAMTKEEHNYYTRTEPVITASCLSGVYTEKGWCRNFKGFIQQRALMD